MKENFWKSKNMVAKEKRSEEELADTKPKKKKSVQKEWIPYCSTMNKIHLVILMPPDIMIQIF